MPSLYACYAFKMMSKCRTWFMQVPRVHALLARKLTAQDRAGALVVKGPSELHMQAVELRQQALHLLSYALGDGLAAEYVLLQLLSR